MDSDENMARSIKFENFDMLNDVPLDHHYLTSKSYKANKYVIREWEILKDNLPESIYVHAYEPRIDLLRSVIIGPHMTPYHDGLFFFDIYLSSDYPNSPPQVHYHSHGYHLNPNLYQDGFVCLSLINTWMGNSGEIWGKKKSTILQLLVSIQGLVLNENPFFNEPGTENDILDPRVLSFSKSYNEDVFIFSCMSMLQTLRKPPGGFGVFIVEHFKNCKGSILAAAKAYENGEMLVGHFQLNGSSSSSKIQVSTEFKIKLMKIGEDLEKAFAKIEEVTDDSEKVTVGNVKKEDIIDGNELQTTLQKDINGDMKFQKKVKKHESNLWNKVFGCFKPIFK